MLTLTALELNEIRWSIDVSLTDTEIPDDRIQSSLVLGEAVDYVVFSVLRNINRTEVDETALSLIDAVEAGSSGAVDAFVSGFLEGLEPSYFRRAVLFRTSGNLVPTYRNVVQQTTGPVTKDYDAPDVIDKQAEFYGLSDKEVLRLRSQRPDIFVKDTGPSLVGTLGSLGSSTDGGDGVSGLTPAEVRALIEEYGGLSRAAVEALVEAYGYLNREMVAALIQIFKPSLALGTFENALGGAIAGHYVRKSATRVDVSHRNIANEDMTEAINDVQVGFGLVFGDNKIFVIEWTNENASYRSFNGFWANGEPDTTAESARISIKVITHELRMIRFLTAGQIKSKVPEIQQAYDKTADIHLQERPGDFVNMNDAAVAGISLIENTNANRSALDSRNYNFVGLTWQNTTVDIPNDGNEYWVVVRLARALGNIETQFQLINDDPEEGTAHLYRSRQGDDTWHYYQVTADRESVWTLQRRATATHTRWDAPLGDAPLRQVEALIPDVPEHEGLTPQQRAQFESLVAKTADLLIETRETWAAATDASFLALPADNAQLLRVRSGNAPQGLTGWTTDVTTTDARVILIRVPVAAQLADYRILLGDDNAVRLDSYGVNATDGTYAYMTSTSLILQEASRIRLQHHGTATHTRFIGMLADAIMARLLPALPAEGQRESKVPQFDGNNLVWQVLTGGGGGGLTSSQLARLLPSLPSEGERNLKIAQFVNDVLTWKVIEGFVSQSDFDNRFNHTPNRVTHLPTRLVSQEQVVLVSTAHWTDEYYRVTPVVSTVLRPGGNYQYEGVNIIPFSSEFPVFGNTGLPNIFRVDRIAAIYSRSEWRPRIVLDKALIKASGGGGLDERGYAISVRSLDETGLPFITDSNIPLTRVSFDTEDSTGTVQELTAGGKTYVAFAPDPPEGRDVINFAWIDNLIQNSGSFEFNLSHTDPDTDAVTFLSDDLTTAWASADEYPAGLYEGDSNGHPIAAALPPLSVWEHVVARSNTYFSGTGPDAAAGVDGQFWANLRNGQIHQKVSGTWTLITDLALQTEISRATEWSTIPNNTQIPADFIARVGGRYFGAKLQHVKTSGSTAPTGDTTNWIELSNREIATARLLPTFPAEGSRDNKVPKFAGDTLTWEVDDTGTGAGTSAQARQWSAIPSNQSVPKGTLVWHGNAAFFARATHNRSGTGPDGDPTNWSIITNYAGAWTASTWYPPGTFVISNGNPYVAKVVVSASIGRPESNATQWQRLNSDPPPPLRQTLTSAATITWAVGSGAVADLTLGHNVTLNISGGVNGETAMLRCLQDSTGSRTLTFHNSIQRGGRDAPTLNTGGSKRDYLLFTRVGTTWIYLGVIADE